jgi:hypothetical protein
VSFPARRMAVFGLAALMLVPVATADAKKKKKPPRPTAGVVKALFADTWDTEFEHSTGGPGTITLKFEKVRFGKTRRSSAGESIQIPYKTWITPVQATFVQTIQHTSSEPELSSPFVQPTSPSSTYTEVTRVVAEGNFYKSSFGWRYVQKGAKTTTLSGG